MQRPTPLVLDLEEEGGEKPFASFSSCPTSAQSLPTQITANIPHVSSSLFLADPGASASVCAAWEKRVVCGARALPQEDVGDMLLCSIGSHSEQEGRCLMVRSIPLSLATSTGKFRNMAAPG